MKEILRYRLSADLPAGKQDRQAQNNGMRGDNMNKLKKYFSRTISLIACLGGLSLALTSCGENSGLGSEVDTEAPKIYITYPPASAIIRDKFVLGGKWTDDKLVKSVTVSVKKIVSDSEKNEVYSEDVTPDEDGTWQLELNSYDTEKGTWQFSDGSYEISAIAKDNAGNYSSENARGFIIDNTAPVLVLTKPTSVDIDNPKAYGRTVQFEGTFSETCPDGIANLEVAFYNESGERITIDNFENVNDMSNSNPLVVAQFFESTEREFDDSLEGQAKAKRWANYKALYGDTNIENFDNISDDERAVTSKLSFAVTAKDSAKLYQDISDENGKDSGNSSTTYYRGTSDMLNLIRSNNDEFPKFTILSLKNYLSGTDTTDGDSEKLEKLAQIVKAAESTFVKNSEGVATASISESIFNTSTEDGEVYLKFSINPQNNPTFTVSGMAINGESNDDNYTDGYRNYLPGSTINIAMIPGLDGTFLKTSSVTVYYALLNEEDNTTGEKKLLWTYNEDKAIEYAKTVDSTLTDERAKIAVNISDAQAEKYRYTRTTETETTDSIMVSASLDSSLVTTGSKYLITVEGKDTDGQDIIKSEQAGFGFCARSNSSVPVVFVGRKSEGGIISKIENATSNRDNLSSFTKENFVDDKLSFSGYIEVGEEFNLDKVNTDSWDNTNEKQEIYYEVTVTDTKTMDKETKKIKLNEEDFTAKLDVGSAFNYNWCFTFTPNENMKNLVSNSNGLYTVDVSITAKNAGGAGITTRTFYLDSNPSEFSTVTFVAEDNNDGKVTYYDKTSELYYLNNATDYKYKLSGTVTDNYKIGKTYYKIEGFDASNAPKSYNLSEDKYASNVTWEFTGIDLSGFVSQTSGADAVLTIISIDDAGNEAKKELKIEFDTTNPKWKPDDSNYKFTVNKNECTLETVGDKWFKDSNLPVSGCYTEEGSGVSIVYYWVKNPNGITPSTSNLSSANGNVSVTNSTGIAYFTQTLGSFAASEVAKNGDIIPNALYLVAVDNVGNKSTATEIKINLDTQFPVLSSDKSGLQYTNGASDIKVGGTYTDDLSGVASVSLKINGKGSAITQTFAEPKKSGDWEITIPQDTLKTLEANTIYSVNVTITDAGENKTSSTIFNLQLDKAPPTVEISKPSSDVINSTVTLEGTVSYEGASADSLKVYYVVSDTEPTGIPTDENLLIGSPSDIYKWSISGFDAKTKSGLSEEAPSKKLYIVSVVTDTAGNKKSYPKPYTVDQNTDRPIITISSIANADAWLKSENRKLQGTISDDDGIESLKIAVKYKDESEFSPYSSDNITLSNGNWTYEFAKGKDSDDIQIKFQVKDSAGTTFETGSESRFTRPYYQFSGTTKAEIDSQNASFTDYGLDNVGSISIKLDTLDPSVYTLALDINTTDTLDSSATVYKDADSIANHKVSLSRYAGGNYKYVKFYLPVFDANLDKVIYEIKNSNGDSKSTGSLTATETTTKQGDITYTCYETSAIDISAWDSDSMTVTVTATDKSGRETETSGSFYIDNNGPDEIEILSPISTDAITGDVEISGMVEDTGIGKVTDIAWLIPPKNYNAANLASDTYAWKNSNNSGTNTIFKFVFNSGTDNDLTQYDDETTYAVEKNSNDTYKIPVFFKATDSLGNVHIHKDWYLTHDPDGDRPLTELSYPIKKDYDVENGVQKPYITLSGRVQVTGSVEIYSGTCEVGAVYFQIGTVGTDGTPDFTYANLPQKIKSEITALGGDDVRMTYTKLKAAYVEGKSSTEKDLHYNDSAWWGLPATWKSTSWSALLNTAGSLNPDGDETTNIAVRATAINDYGKLGVWTEPVFIHIDKNAPGQSAELRTYINDTTLENVASKTPSLSKDYSSGMYLRGTKYLVVHIEDNDSIDSTSLNVKRGSSKLTTGVDYYASSVTSAQGTTPASMDVYIKIESTSMAKNVSYTVYVTDSSSHSSSMTYNFNIDNDAPKIMSINCNGDEAIADGIANSNYHYTIDSKITDDASGFEKFFFQFVRKNVTDGSNPRVLDVFKKYKGEDDANSEYKYTSTYINDLAECSVSQKDVSSSGTEGTFYGKKYTGELETGRKTFTASGILKDVHVRKGGLIYIGGEYKVIKSISNNTVTFEEAVPKSVIADSSMSNVEAVFPYGQVIDNANDGSSWNNATHIYTIPATDDDGMAESVKKKQTEWTLQAGLYSDYMTDGPVTFIYVAFDKAGNITYGSIDTIVQNNAPRIAKLYLGTDLSGDGNFTYSTTAGALNEFNEYDFINSAETSIESSRYKQNVDFETAASTYGYGVPFIIKDKLAVVPEITGGNGTIMMKFLNNAESDKGRQQQSDDTDTSFYSVGANNFVSATFSGYTNSTKNLEDSTLSFVISDSNLTSVADGENKAMSFTFWDSTEGCTIGKDSNYCFVRVSDFTVDLVDAVSPKSAIDDLYWKGLTDNSTYGSSVSGDFEVSNYSDLKGHIELPADLSDKDKAYLGSDDPKVSGKIMFKGYAYDDQRLSSLWFAFVTDDGKAFTPGNYVTDKGDYNKKAGGVTASAGTYTHANDGRTYYQAAYYTPSTGKWASASAKMFTIGTDEDGNKIQTDADGWEFSVSDDSKDGAYLRQDGHKVFWTLSIDTAKITGTAQKDVKVRVIAFDRNPNVVSTTVDSTKGDSNYNKPYYKMDVVPYVTSITTSLSSIKSTNPTVYSRTTSGHYPVYITAAGNFDEADKTYEKVVLKGFNLAQGGTVKFDAATSDNSATIESDLSFKLPTGAKSGSVTVSVNNITALNNTNNNDAHGAYEGKDSSTTGDYSILSNYYNRQPNDANNNLLTDDLYFDVWQFNSVAVVPDGNSALDIMMKINPVSDMIGFAYCNGEGKWSMANGTENSYVSWRKSRDFIQCTGFAFDTNGVSYGTALGGESGDDYGDTFDFFTSKWGPDITKYTPQEGKTLRIGELALKSYATMAKDRYKSPSIVSDGTCVYLAYYDLLSGEIRFQGGGNIPDSKGSIGTLTDAYTDYKPDRTYQSTSVKSLEAEHGLVQVIANGYNNTKTDRTGSNLLGYSGEYVAIGIANNHVVMVWYDAHNNNLEYAYSTKTVDNFKKPTNGFVTENTEWTKVGTILKGAGKYCQLAVDFKNGIHIAAFDSAKGDLKYVYLEGFEKASSKKECTVDSYQKVGQELTIDVALNSAGKPVPYIGYYSSSKKPCYAYLAEPVKFYDNDTLNGAESDLYTGIWECTVVPSPSKITEHSKRRINVGVWKTNGVLKTNPTTIPNGITYNGTSSWGDNGKLYGNGTSNAVLSYGVRHPTFPQDYGETAQKR